MHGSETTDPGGTLPVTLHVCVTCRHPGDTDPEAPRAGARLHAALQSALTDAPVPGLALSPVECLSNCSRGCTAALAGPGRWTYVYGDLDPVEGAAVLLEGATKYAATADGLIPWRERPLPLRKGVIARIPALPTGARP